MSDKARKYVVYAIGEILLVVIGILIALQINTWNQERLERDLEQRFLIELKFDLESDSVALAGLKRSSDLQIQSKELIIRYFSGETFPPDTLIEHFDRQWKPIFSFNPNTTTLDEMKSTGGLRVIQNADIRRGILRTYNAYQDFHSSNMSIYQRQQEELWQLVFSRVPNLYGEVTGRERMDIISALNDFEIVNRIEGNYAIGFNRAVIEIANVNHAMLRQVQEEISKVRE